MLIKADALLEIIDALSLRHFSDAPIFKLTECIITAFDKTMQKLPPTPQKAVSSYQCSG